MVELSSKRLKAAYLKLIAIRNIVSYIQEQTFNRNDDKFLKAIGFPYLGEISKDKRGFIGGKMDEMMDSIGNLIVIGLVSDFEKIVFERVENASGEISKIVRNRYDSEPFKNFPTDFIKTSKDIDKLSIIKAIVSSKLPDALLASFGEVVDLRNRLAHGKRFGQDSLMSFDDIAQTLDDVLNYV